MNSSEVINARELKFCEGCGVLLVRLRGSKVQFCPDCEQSIAIATGECKLPAFQLRHSAGLREFRNSCPPEQNGDSLAQEFIIDKFTERAGHMQ